MKRKSGVDNTATEYDEHRRSQTHQRRIKWVSHPSLGAQTTVVDWKIRREEKEGEQKSLQSGKKPLDVAVASMKSPNNKP